MGFKATENTKIEAKFHNEQSANSAVFGADKAWAQDAFGIWINSTIAVPVVGTVSGTIGVSYSSAYDTFTLDKNTLKLNGGPSGRLRVYRHFKRLPMSVLGR